MEGFDTRLLAWFDREGRKDLPWQVDITPYRVWVSEIMLQQTQVATVIPYYQRFMARFPTVESLACAEEDEVLHYWTGLGYYARARNLHKAARQLVKEYEGDFPNSVDELMTLPGIGRSTAGAIVAIACDRRAAILDGNVKRVLARYFAIEGWPGESRVAKELWAMAETLTPTERVADYTQAIMDLGATVCTRTSPKCGICPFSQDCIAFQTGRIQRLPGKKPKKRLPEKSTCMLLIESPDGELLLEKRPDHGIWGGLWGFPECQLDEIDETLNNLPLATDQHLSFRPERSILSFRPERSILSFRPERSILSFRPERSILSFRPERSGVEKSRPELSPLRAPPSGRDDYDFELTPSGRDDYHFELTPSARDGSTASISQLEPFRHTFTHFHLDITPIHVQLATPVTRVNESGRHIWYSPDAPQSIGLTRPVTKLIEQLR